MACEREELELRLVKAVVREAEAILGESERLFAAHPRVKLLKLFERFRISDTEVGDKHLSVLIRPKVKFVELQSTNTGNRLLGTYT